MECNWEVLCNESENRNDINRTCRMKLKGGFLYRHHFIEHRGYDAVACGTSMVYVPDPPVPEKLKGASRARSGE